jgi:hypothetical protein
MVFASFLSSSLCLNWSCRTSIQAPDSAQTPAETGSNSSFFDETERLKSSSVGSKSTASDPHVSHWPCFPNPTSTWHSMHHQRFICLSLLKQIRLVYEDSLGHVMFFGDRQMGPIFEYMSTGEILSHRVGHKLASVYLSPAFASTCMERTRLGVIGLYFNRSNL